MPRFSKLSFMMLFLGIKLEQTLERQRCRQSFVNNGDVALEKGIGIRK